MRRQRATETEVPCDPALSVTSFQLGSEDGGGGGITPMEDTLKPMDRLRFPETAAWPRSSAMFFSSVKSSSSETKRRQTAYCHFLFDPSE